MGKQSSRMIYRGKDHKDIFFQGRYHDAMYKGMELIWHKIRKEGYYSIIVKTKTKEMFVLIFSEKTGEFEEIMKIENNVESDAYYVELLVAMDSERIYVSTLGIDSLLASSIDGINFENTNLEYEENIELLLCSNYHSDYLWRFRRSSNSVWLTKNVVSFKNGTLSVNTKSNDTHLGRFAATWEDANMGDTYGRNAKIGMHVHNITHYPLSENEFRVTTIMYYDVENETSGEICKITAYGTNVSKFFCINNMYIFFITISDKEDNHKRYVYYSNDGINYENSLMDTGKGNHFNASRPDFIFYRGGIYYMYGGAKSGNIGAPATLVLTKDFIHFSIKDIPNRIYVGTKEYNIASFMPIEYNSATQNAIYFFNGERSTPEDGMLLTGASNRKLLLYFDNMFFRESGGNRFIELGAN